MKLLIPILFLAIFSSCDFPVNQRTSSESETKIIVDKESVPNSKPTKQEVQLNLVPVPKNVNYSWLDEKPVGNTLVNRIAVPEGYKRMDVPRGSFAEWLRHLPMKEGRGRVKLFNGTYKGNQSAHEAIIDMDVQPEDLQQCADAIMRLKSEFHYSRKEFENIHFNYTSGHKVSFDDWRKGRRPKVTGNKVNFVNTENISDEYSNFRNYLTQIFNYAGTASLSKELKTKSIEKVRPGDLFIQGGFPGHAILVLDVAVNEKGERIFLTGQSYMPAQEFHLLKNPENSKFNPWYKIDNEFDLETPEWRFKVSDLKTWAGS